MSEHSDEMFQAKLLYTLFVGEDEKSLLELNQSS